MTNSETVAAAAVPAHVQLIQMCAGAWVAAAVCAAAKLGIADHLANGAQSAGELATVTLQVGMPISCRTSFMTGAKSNA